MSNQTLTFTKNEHTAIFHIIGFEKDSAGLQRLSGELTEFCAEITADDEIRVVILTASAGENSFSIETGLNGALEKHKGTIQSKRCSIGEPVAKLDRPVIAAINGDAIGQGLELALACDLRVAVETSRFGLPHIKRGMIPRDGGTQRLVRLVGVGKSMEMILTGDLIDAREAKQIGLINRIVSPEELMPVAEELANGIASRGPDAVKYAKEAISKGMDLTLEQGLHLEADLYFLLHTTRDRTEGIRAFQEKRTPLFEGK